MTPDVLFVFRGIRFLQVIAALLALVMGLLAVLSILAVTQGQTWYLLGALVFGLVFLFGFAVALRAPTSFVAVADERTRIRFAGFVDTVIANDSVIGAKLVSWPLWGGIGVRTNFKGHVALTSAWGTAVELQLREPIRVWVIPRLWRTSATRLTLSLRNGHKLVERLGGSRQPSPGATPGPKKRGARAR